MGYPEEYPEEYKEGIFAHSYNDGHVFVFTRSGGRLHVYAFQHLGHIDGRRDDLAYPGDTGDVYHLYGKGVIGDRHYDPSDEDNFVPEDMSWSMDKPRLSRPVRRWLKSREMHLANRENLLRMVESEKGIDLSATWLD